MFIKNKSVGPQKVCAVIAAAGSGTRMGEGYNDKLFIDIGGKPLIFYTLNNFVQAETVDYIVIVTKPVFFEKFLEIIRKYDLGDKIACMVAGGDTRQQSVTSAVMAVPEDTGYIAIHDGARPFVTPEIIDTVNRLAVEKGAATCCVPVKDTIKTVDGTAITGTVDRSTLAAVQTPQTFRLDSYKEALFTAAALKKDFTDDCQLIENMGGTVYYCSGSYNNIKVTTAEDLALCEILAKM